MYRLVLVITLFSLTTACTVTPDITSCDELLCPVGTECDGHGRCVADLALAACENKSAGAACTVIAGANPIDNGLCLPTSCVAIGCGTGIIDEAAGEVCADTNRDGGDGCAADCKSNETCGNGVLDLIKGESCDDGNFINGDGCQAGCIVPTCGDSVTDLQFNEVCDQGAANSNAPDAACRPNCQPQRCGDAIIDNGEVCDDGNTTRGDGCSQECQSDESCGNGVIDSITGETCDDGNQDDGDGCQADCKLPICGDGILDIGNGEYCDEGAGNSEAPSAACRPNCQPQRCGDGIEDAGEACDDGNLTAGDGCTPDCESAEVCGNNIVDYFADEQCDDGNFRSHDGCAHTCEAETATWALMPTTSLTRPSSAVAFDAARGVTVLFGGVAGGINYFNETWEFDGLTWLRREPAASPPARQGHVMAYDAARQVVVMFGGSASNPSNGNVISYQDTWEYNGETWSQRTTTAAPSAGDGRAMAYDAARARMVLFGGQSTWEYDGVDWSQQFPPTVPGFRYFHALAYDATRHKTVLFGGFSNGSNLNDTWDYDGTTWTLRSPTTSPSGRRDHAMAYDATRGTVVMFGGSAWGATDTSVWEFDGTVWSQRVLANGPTTPSKIAYDSKRQAVVAIGTGTWDLTTAGWTPRLEVPPARTGHAAAYDAATGMLVQFGGQDDSYQGFPLADTWIYRGGQWMKANPAAAPDRRQYHAMAYDEVRRKIVLFGGFGDGIGGQPHTFWRNDTWEFDGVTWTQRLFAVSPPRRYSHAMTYDPVRQRIVLFGGYSSTGTYLADTWEYDGSAWTQRFPTASPPGRTAHAMAYAPARGTVLLWGGAQPGLTSSLWEYDGATWQVVVTPASPPARYSHAMVYDPLREVMLVYGGRNAAGQTINDTWEFDGQTWNARLTDQAPSVRHSFGLHFDAVQGAMVLFAGANGGTELGDTWRFRMGRLDVLDEACQGEVDRDGDGVAGCDDPDCDGVCDPFCLPNTSCDPGRERCGDGVCTEARENWANCPADCESAMCGDGVCGSEENLVACAGDCFVCGDLVCSAPHESAATCAVDCP